MKRKLIVICLLTIGIFSSYPLLGSNNEKDVVEDIPSPGACNAIKRAYQMVDICFTPLNDFTANPNKKYYRGKEYQGLIYSNVEELQTYIGTDVSFHTYMTAIHNPKSVIYTENIKRPPYHGIKHCGAYYGTICSSFVAYALDLKVLKFCYERLTKDYFQLVNDQSSRGIRLADVIHSNTHMMLVTGIKRDSLSGKAVEIEICESALRGCRRKSITGDKLESLISDGRKLYRYKYLDSIKYKPLTDFVALGDEQITPFKYNDDICTSRGDKACFTVGDSVVLNIAKGFKVLEVYKDGHLYKKMRVGNGLDVILKDLPYGDYNGRLVDDHRNSDFTYWKVIDVNVEIDSVTKHVRFHSENATPVYLDFVTLSGVRPPNASFEFAEDDVKNGILDVSSYRPYKKWIRKGLFVRVHFECEYGRVMNKPIQWIIM